MGMYWGAKLFYGCELENNPLYGKYNPETYEYEFEEPFEELQDLIAHRDGIEIPEPWNVFETENRTYEEYSKDVAYIEARAERDHIYAQLKARIPLSVEGYDQDWGIAYAIDGFYYSTYQSEIKDIPLLENPSDALIKECVDFCARYDLPPFENYGWKLQGEIEH